MIGPSWGVVGFDENWGLSYDYGVASRGVQSVTRSNFIIVYFYTIGWNE